MADGRTPKGEVEVVELGRDGQAMARRVAESKATIPHLYLAADVELDALERSGLGLREVVLAAAARALREWPGINASYRDGHLERYSRVSIGWVVPRDDVVVVPVVADADTLAPAEIAAEIARLEGLVADGAITPPQLSGATFTVTDLGATGVERMIGVVHQPQVASLAIGAAGERAVVRNGAVTAGAVASLSLSCDHRALHGAIAAQFLGRVRVLVERPDELES